MSGVPEGGKTEAGATVAGATEAGATEPGVTEAGEPEVLATLRASGPRRMIATAMLVTLGALLLWVSLAAPPETLVWRLVLVAGGAAALFGAVRLWRASAGTLVLTRAALCDAAGRDIARLDEVVAVDRGMAAFKPANGFLLRLSRPAPRHWSPGLWWRLGRNVGVGGVTGAAETRALADLVRLLVAERSTRGERAS
jgi:hypothetical protein